MPSRRAADRAAVLYVLPSGTNLRGGARSNLLLTQHLESFEPHVLTLRGSAVGVECRRAGVAVHEADPHIDPEDAGRFWQRRRRTAYQNLMMAGLTVARQIRPKIVQADYEYFPVAAGIGLAGSLPTVMYVRGWLTNGLHTRALLKLAAADAVVTISQSIRNQILDDCPVIFRRRLRSKLFVVRNSVTIPDERPASLSSGIVGIVGTLEPRKRQLDLIREWCRRTDTRHVPLQLIGDRADAEYAECCNAEIERAGTMHRIEMVGFQPDMTSWYRSLDVLICASEWEGIPRAVLEAASHGVPSVSTNFPGADEAVRSGATGVICNRLPDVIDAALRLRQDTATRRSYGIAAREHVRRRFDPCRNAKMLEEHVYAPLLACR